MTLDVWPPEPGEKELLLMRPPVCGHAEQPEAPGWQAPLRPEPPAPCDLHTTGDAIPQALS